MSRATRPVSNRIAVVFDFDETLTPRDSFEVLLEACDLDVNDFKHNRIPALIEQGWEKYLARAYCLIQASQMRKEKITEATLIEVGKTIELFKGTETLYDYLQTKLQTINPDVDLEFYLISGGFVDIPRHTAIAKHFKQMWGCEFHYGDTGAIEFIKRQMTHSEKTRFLYSLSKGFDCAQNEKDLIYNYHDLSADELHVPLSQVIYVGDGASDIPCFAAIKQYHGMSIGIYPDGRSAQDWEHLEKVSASQKLSNLVPACYEEDSELVQSLRLGVEYMAKKIALRQMSIGE